MLPHATWGAALLNEEMTSLQQDRDAVGLTVWSVDEKGNMCSIGSAGERIKDSGEPFVVTGDSRHVIGSVTKSMTAVLLAILIQDGSIPMGWEAKLQHVLPMAQATAYENVTLRELAGMVSGLRRDGPWWNYRDQTTDLREQRRLATIDALQSQPISPPGTRYLYSNWGYVVAGHIVEHITGELWEDVLSQRLFVPLGIHLPDPSFGAPSNSVDPWGHFTSNHISCNPETFWTKCDFAEVFGAAGTFSGPVAAMAKYLSWHIDCHNGGNSDILLQDECRQLHEPANATISNYGYGWRCSYRYWANGKACTHDGTNLMNLYLVWLGFGINRAFSAFTNSWRVIDGVYVDYQMLDTAILTAINGPQSCDAPIPSIAGGSLTRFPTTTPTLAPTLFPTRTMAPVTPTPAPSDYPSQEPMDATCSAKPVCAHLSGDCCPTTTGIYLDCCNWEPPTAESDISKCSANPGCSNLAGDCCPTVSGQYLYCCGAQSPACAAHSQCAALGLTGICCPTKDDVYLDCCDRNFASGSAHPGCPDDGKNYCPNAKGVFDQCCLNDRTITSLTFETAPSAMPAAPSSGSRSGGGSFFFYLFLHYSVLVMLLFLE